MYTYSSVASDHGQLPLLDSCLLVNAVSTVELKITESDPGRKVHAYDVNGMRDGFMFVLLHPQLLCTVGVVTEGC